MLPPTSPEGPPQQNIPVALYQGLLGANHAFIDRVDLRVRQTRSTQGEAWQRYTADPARYLPVPSVPQATLVAVCSPMLDSTLTGEEQSALAHRPDWLSALETRLTAEAHQRVRWAVTNHLIGHLRAWLAEQALPETPFLRPVLEQPPRPTPPPVAPPRAAPAPSAPSNDLWIQNAEVMRALLVDRDDQAPWMHLRTFEVAWAQEGEDGPGPPVGEAEWDWVRLPRVRTEEQLAFAREAVGPHLDAAQWEQVQSRGKQWSERLERLLDPPDWDRFQSERRRWLAGQLEVWLREHRMPIERFLKPYRPRHRAPQEAATPRTLSAPTQPNDRLAALRERLHQAIDRMGWDELAALPVPARLLLPEPTIEEEGVDQPV